jgi:peptide/nickel transport system substrate-binding protein
MSASARRLRALAAVSALVPALLAAPRARPALGPRYGGEVRIAVADLPADAGPAVPRAAAERVLAGLVHETLLGVDEEGRPRPALAQAWASGAEGREWTLRLAAATFHDGAPVQATDALRALRRFLRSGSAAAAHLARRLDGGEAFRQGATDALPGLSAPDEARVVLRFREPSALPLAPLASPAAAVVSARGAGAGPFSPTTPPTSRGLSATAFSRHVRGRPFLDVVRLVPPSSDRTRVDVAALEGNGPPAAPAGGLLLLSLDPAAGLLADARARARIASAVDRALLARHFLPGGEPAETLLASALLAPWPAGAAGGAAGAADPGPLAGRLTLRVGPDVPASASQRVVAHLTALGLEVRALPDAPAAPTSGQARLVVWYPEVAEAGLALEELAALAGAPPEVRATIEAAGALRDVDRRRAALQRAEEALRAGHVLVPLARVPLGLGPRPGLHGLRASASGVLVLEDAWVEP